MRLGSLFLLVGAWLALGACQNLSTSDQAHLITLDSNLARAFSADSCAPLATEESVIVLPQADCGGCNALTLQILATPGFQSRVLTAGLNRHRIERQLGHSAPVCYTPFGLEDYNLQEILVPSLCLRKGGRLKEIIILNGPGIKRLQDLGLKRPD